VGRGTFNGVGFSGGAECEMRRGLEGEVVLEVSGFLTLLGNKYYVLTILISDQERKNFDKLPAPVYCYGIGEHSNTLESI